ncbi:MAG: Flp pilus assembly protein ATPase CpaE-like protein [Candidatus Solibacter sp.]|nr:Flp pilus assembly protein ATPase CpaE-like protein [Candidatus Solibacter sp.]
MPAPVNAAPAPPWKPLVICPHTEIGKQLPESLRKLFSEPPFVIPDYPRAGVIAAIAAQKGANICFLEVATDAARAQTLISELAPAIPVVALLVANDADLILRCLRRGACDFLTDTGVDSLRAVFERLGRSRAPVAHRRAGKIWCVVPGKPGCGASTLAVHLAIDAHARGGAALLVDADPLAASAAFLLKLKPEFHLGDLLRDWKRIDQDLWSRLTLSACGIDVLAAPEDAATRFEIGRQLAGEFCNFWRERYETVVLDLADVRSAVDSGFAAVADTVLLVTTNELAALQTTRRAIACLEPAGSDRSRLRLVLNRYTPATGLKHDDVHKVLSLEPFAALGNDYEAIQSALLEGRPVQSNSRYAADVRALCAQLQDRAAPPKEHTSWLSSLRVRK